MEDKSHEEDHGQNVDPMKELFICLEQKEFPRPEIIEAAKNAWKMTSHQACTDSLTGLDNYKSFLEALERERIRVLNESEERLPTTLIYLDLDEFKRINDQYGHGVGDIYLQMVAKIFKSLIRSGDLLARLGGDEFGILLPRTTLEKASEIALRFQTELDKGLVWHEQVWKISASIGMIELNQGICGLSVDQLLNRADLLMYEDKKAKKARQGNN